MSAVRIQSEKGAFVQSSLKAFDSEVTVGPTVDFDIDFTLPGVPITPSSNVRDCATYLPPFFPLTNSYEVDNTDYIKSNMLPGGAWPVDGNGRFYMLSAVRQIETPTNFTVDLTPVPVVDTPSPYPPALTTGCMDLQTGDWYGRWLDDYASTDPPALDTFQFAMFLKNLGDLLNPTHPWLAQFPAGTYKLSLTGFPQGSPP